MGLEQLKTNPYTKVT